MKLMKELLIEAKNPGKCLVVFIDDEDKNSNIIYDAVETVLNVFGYKDVGTLEDFDITGNILKDYGGDLRGMSSKCGVWATSKPTKSDIMKSLDTNDVVGVL